MSRAVSLALAAGVALFWAARIAPGDRIALANGDLFGYFYPAYEAAARLMRAGEWPLWNPWQLCGVPWLATMQAGFLYPPHAVFLVLPTHRAMAVSSGAHVIFVALTTCAFARRLGLGAAPAVVAAILFACRGHVPVLTLSPAAFEAAAWLPLGAVATLDLARGRLRTGAIVLAIATAASLLAGYPQSTLFVLYAWATLLVAGLAADRAGLRGAAARGGVFAVALGLGALVAAAQLLPTMELTGDGVRGTRALPLSQIYPLGGGVIGNRAWAFLTTDALGRGSLALGVTTLLLVPLAWTHARARWAAWWALGLGGAALLYALGPVTPMFAALLALPGLAWFRIPTRALFLVDFCWAVLAAIGFDALLERTPSAARRGLAGATALVVAALVVGGRVGSSAGPVVAVVAATATAALALRPSAGGLRRVVLATVVAAIAIELSAARPRGLAFPFGPSTPALIARRQSLYEELRKMAGPDRVWIFTGTPPVDLAPKLPTLFHVRAIDDYEPLVPRRHGQYVTFFGEGAPEPGRPPFTFSGYLNNMASPAGRPGPGTRWRLYDLAAVRWVLIAPHELTRPEVARMVREAGLVPHDPLMGLLLYENPTHVPRAYVTYRTRPAPDTASLLAAIARPDFDPLASSYVEGVVPAAPDAPARGVPAAIVRDDDRVVELDAELAAPGLVVLADSYYPGWTATVDGAPTEVLAVDHLFRGVAAGAGRHRVRFAYDPASMRRGVALSLVGVVGLAALVFVRRRRP